MTRLSIQFAFAAAATAFLKRQGVYLSTRMVGQPAIDNKIYTLPSSSIPIPVSDILWAIDYTVFSPDLPSSRSCKVNPKASMPLSRISIADGQVPEDKAPFFLGVIGGKETTTPSSPPPGAEFLIGVVENLSTNPNSYLIQIVPYSERTTFAIVNKNGLWAFDQKQGQAPPVAGDANVWRMGRVLEL
ncbi:hypothetical protein BG015_001839 [Linnemannia schmuckeri]|uniref:Uncharacterized protein n=1 Tax=Linnemannia schmuckeri TaxID=64567 RepID=A0A9P5RPS5_9FUNG|nr:hypothetical protein BG015_001839 [Linnemannia schmuckeri]